MATVLHVDSPQARGPTVPLLRHPRVASVRRSRRPIDGIEAALAVKGREGLRANGPASISSLRTHPSASETRRTSRAVPPTAPLLSFFKFPLRAPMRPPSLACAQTTLRRLPRRSRSLTFPLSTSVPTPTAPSPRNAPPSSRPPTRLPATLLRWIIRTRVTLGPTSCLDSRVGPHRPSRASSL